MAALQSLRSTYRMNSGHEIPVLGYGVSNIYSTNNSQ